MSYQPKIPRFFLLTKIPVRMWDKRDDRLHAFQAVQCCPSRRGSEARYGFRNNDDREVDRQINPPKTAEMTAVNSPRETRFLKLRLSRKMLSLRKLRQCIA